MSVLNLKDQTLSAEKIVEAARSKHRLTLIVSLTAIVFLLSPQDDSYKLALKEVNSIKQMPNERGLETLIIRTAEEQLFEGMPEAFEISEDRTVSIYPSARSPSYPTEPVGSSKSRAEEIRRKISSQQQIQPNALRYFHIATIGVNIEYLPLPSEGSSLGVWNDWFSNSTEAIYENPDWTSLNIHRHEVIPGSSPEPDGVWLLHKLEFKFVESSSTKSQTPNAGQYGLIAIFKALSIPEIGNLMSQKRYSMDTKFGLHPTRSLHGSLKQLEDSINNLLVIEGTVQTRPETLLSTSGSSILVEAKTASITGQTIKVGLTEEHETISHVSRKAGLDVDNGKNSDLFTKGSEPFEHARKHWSELKNLNLDEAIYYLRAKSTELDDITILGITVPGALAVLAIPVFYLSFFAHLLFDLKTLNRLNSSNIRIDMLEAPWFPLYKDTFAVFSSVLSILILPMIFSAFLIYKYRVFVSEQLFVFVSILVFLSTVIQLGVIRELFILKPHVLNN